MNESEYFGLGLLVGFIISIIAILVAHNGDTLDDINSRGLGEKICGDMGLVYDSRDIGFNSVPTFYCVPNVSESMKTNYVFMKGG